MRNSKIYIYSMYPELLHTEVYTLFKMVDDNFVFSGVRDSTYF